MWSVYGNEAWSGAWALLAYEASFVMRTDIFPHGFARLARHENPPLSVGIFRVRFSLIDWFSA